MDDVPAGPASPEPRRPSLTVVIPVRNGGRDFEHCLRRLQESDYRDYELIVVDDGSSDQTAATARRAGARVLVNTAPQGPAAARNQGAREATAPLIFFLDGDVIVHPNTLSRAIERFHTDPDLAALFGSYDDAPGHPGIVSQYRNLLHHFVHQQGDFHDGIRPAHTFWTGCGAIRRDVFLKCGGFDPRLYPRPAIEDIELGYRITRAGGRIVLARDVLATHMKRWSLVEMVRTDVMRRGVPWMLLLKRTQIVETDLNVKRKEKLCVALTGLAIVLAIIGLAFPLAWPAAVAAAATMAALNAPLFRFLARKRGLLFTAAALPLHMLYYCSCGASVVIALSYWTLADRPRSYWTTRFRRADPSGRAIPRPAGSRWAMLSRWRTRSR